MDGSRRVFCDSVRHPAYAAVRCSIFITDPGGYIVIGSVIFGSAGPDPWILGT